MPEATLTVEAVAEPKHGTSQRGDWTKWSFKGSDGNWYASFKEGVGTRFVKGETYTIEYEDGERGRSVKYIKSQGSPADAVNHPASSPGFTGGEKDRLIVRQTAWKAAATLLAGYVANPEDLFKTAAKVAHGIENDIYREQPKPQPSTAPAPEGPDDSEIPF